MNKTLLDLFQYQAHKNEIYSRFLQYLKCDISSVVRMEQIPFLPIAFFKQFEIKTGNWPTEKIFESSGTTLNVRSVHHVRSEEKYLKNAELIFEKHYGPIEDYCFLALLPGYLERANSSLISMVDRFISISNDGDSGFYLDDFERLYRMLMRKVEQGKKTILWGVSYALLDFGDQYDFPNNDIIIMETGGMKGTRKEVSKNVLHDLFRRNYNTNHIHSEYGMTELFSQFYSQSDGAFKINDRVDVLIRPIDDPLGSELIGRRGRLDIVDWANEDTCSFIATDDLGIKTDKNELIVIGRIDNSDIRGCNLLYQ